MVAAGVCDQALIQVAYAIGVAQPVGLYINTFGTAKVKDSKGKQLHDGEISEKIHKLFDMRPYSIVQRFGLKTRYFFRQHLTDILAGIVFQKMSMFIMKFQEVKLKL